MKRHINMIYNPDNNNLATADVFTMLNLCEVCELTKNQPRKEVLLTLLFKMLSQEYYISFLKHPSNYKFRDSVYKKYYETGELQEEGTFIDNKLERIVTYRKNGAVATITR